MEKKSIGKFISALRRANGMTQAELGERLNVSDKAVSRWERDECAPDISVIPVLAEIFGVTSDEILRGERINRERTADAEPASDAKSKKQVEYLLDKVRTSLAARSFIALGIVLLGLIAAMLCNFAFTRAYVGFFVACAFELAAVVLEAVFTVFAFSSVSGSDIESERLPRVRKRIVRISLLSFLAAVIVFALELPLAVLPYDAYVGLTAGTWFSYGLNFGAVASVLCAVAFGVGEYMLTRADGTGEKTNSGRKHLRRRAGIFAAMLTVTFIAQAVFDSAVSARTFSHGRTWSSIEKFVEYMETPQWDEGDTQVNIMETVPVYGDSEAEPLPDEPTVPDGAEAVYDSDRIGDDGELFFEWQNHSVAQIEYKSLEKGSVRIITYTVSQLRRGGEIISSVNTLFTVLYIAEAAGSVIVYIRKNRCAEK